MTSCLNCHTHEIFIYGLLTCEMGVNSTEHAFCKLLSVYVFSYFPFGFEGRMWDLILSFPDHCKSFNFLARLSRRLIVELIG